MLTFILIGLSLSLFGVAGVQFLYLNYLERLDRSRKNHIREMEHACRHLTQRLGAAEDRIAEQEKLLEPYYKDEEVWAKVLEER